MNVNKKREKGAVIILYCSNRNLFTVCHTNEIGSSSSCRGDEV